MVRFGLFSSGLLYYALPVLQVYRILQHSPMYLLPRLPQSVRGVLVNEGRVVPVFDLDRLCRGGGVLHDAGAYQILVESEYGLLALMADVDCRIVTEQKGTLVSEENNQEGWVCGIFIYAGIEYKILNIDFLAIEATQVTWRDQSDYSGVRRHP